MDIARITKEVLSSDYPASEPDTLEEILEIRKDAERKAEALC